MLAFTRDAIQGAVKLARREIGALLVLGFGAGGLLLFAKIAEEVLEQETQAFDKAILLAMRNPNNLSDPIGPAWFEEAARDVSALGSMTVLALITGAVLGYLLIVGRKRVAAFLAVAVIGGTGLSSLLKVLFDRGRPEVVTHATEVFTASFPSGHAMLSAVTYLTLAALLMRIQTQNRVRLYFLTLAMTATVLVGLSRIYLGVHWPTDVLAGWCIGAAWASLCWLGAVWLERRDGE